MSIVIEKPGILTTIQDLGRNGFRRFGINPSGAMDHTAARLINVLVGNDDFEAVLEMHFPAPRISFEKNAVIVLGGGNFDAKYDGGKALPTWTPFFVRKGTSISFDERVAGNRVYVAVMGGFKIKKWLGSSSTNLTAHIGGYDGRKLEGSDTVDYNRALRKPKYPTPIHVSPSLIPLYSRFPTVRITEGPEYHQLSKEGRERLLHGDFVVSRTSDRMGFRMSGESISRTVQTEILSSAVSFGTAQLLPDGQLIVLMADHQTTGGYPRIAHVISRDLPLLSQLGPGDKVAFHLVDQRSAEDLMVQFERELSFFRVGCRFHINSWTT